MRNNAFLRLMLPKTLRSRLTLSFLLIILFSTGMFIMSVDLIIRYVSGDVMTIINRRRVFRFVPVFEDYFHRCCSWDGVGPLADEMAVPIPVSLTLHKPLGRGGPPRKILRMIEMIEQNRLILTDPDGRVIWDTLRALNPKDRLSSDLAEQALPIMDSSRIVGRLIRLSAHEDEKMLPIRRLLRRNFFLASVVSGAAALFLSLFFAHRLTRSLGKLTYAVHRFAEGKADAPLPVKSDDEIGLLTRNFNEMVADIDRQQQLRRQMTADIAHELRTPLSIMHLEIEALTDGMQEPSQAADSLEFELEKLRRLVTDLRQLSLADAGAVELYEKPLAFSPFIRGVVAAWPSRFDVGSVDLITDIPKNLPETDADAARLVQVFDNLLSNALRVTPAGKAVSLKARQEGELIITQVKDCGPGIDPDQLEMIFDRFYRADRSRSRDTGGTGLRLAVAKQWVLLHSGEIYAENISDGACFTVRLPIRPRRKRSDPPDK